MTSEREKFAGRLNETLDERGFPRLGQGRQSELAKVLGAPPQQVGKWLKGQD
ncbi:MAG TPA: peptidase S24, partial [Thiotrichales bacterium]|nr:peptidase S24 [Thiotrichales bacterium]